MPESSPPVPTEDGGGVTAVVVAFNGGDALLDCIASLTTQTVETLQIIVVDNSSTDGSVEKLEEKFGATVEVVRRKANAGYAAGANAGMRLARHPFIAVLNQDLLLDHECLELLRDTLLSTSSTALVTPKLVLRNEPARVNAVGNDIHLTGVTSCRGLGSLADGWAGVVEVPAISGAAFMARRDVLAALGGLEEAYFMYLEDADLSLRVRHSGGTCLANCDAVASNNWRLSVSPMKFALLERNRRWMWHRLIGGPIWLLPALWQAEMMGWVYAFLHGRAYVAAKWRAGRDKTAPPKPVHRRELSSVLPALEVRHDYQSLAPGWAAAVGRRLDLAVGYLARRAQRGQR